MIAGGKRDNSLDFVKGVLVLLMLIFHAGNLFMRDSHALWLLDEVLLNFVSGSWVFLSGYLVVRRYGNEVQFGISRVQRRLMLRGAKIIGLFVLLNAAMAGLGLHPGRTGSYDMPTMAQILFYGGGQLTSFEVLLGIGFLLIVAPFCLYLQHKTGLFTWLVVIAISMTSVLSVIVPPNYWLILCGLCGMTIGFWFDEGRIARITRMKLGLTLLLGFGLVGVVSHYTLLILRAFTRDNLFVYLLGVVSMVTLVYISHRWLQPHSHVDEGVRLLGRYSLVCYVLQMGILWGLWWLSYSVAIPASFGLSLSTSFVILFLVIWLIDRLISDHQVFKKIYGYAFQ